MSKFIPHYSRGWFFDSNQEGYFTPNQGDLSAQDHLGLI